MKTNLVIAGLLAALATCTVSAQSFPGKVGNATLALTLSYEEGGYKDEGGNPTEAKLTETPTQSKVLLKTVIKKAKYSNKEFFADLITKGLLTGTASDWSLKYVEAGYIEGFFAVGKTGTVVYLGGVRTEEIEPIVIQNGAGGIASASGNQTANYKTPVKEPQNIKDFSYAYTTASTSTVSLSLRPTNNSDHDIEVSGLWNKNSGYTFKFVVATERETDSYTVSASSFTELVGDSTTDDEESAIVQGSIFISPLKDTEDITAYEEAYPYEPLLGG